MGKWSRYDKTFQSKWLNDPVFGNWLCEKAGDGTKAYCKVCKCDLRAHKTDLIKHQQSSKHQAHASAIAIQPNINRFLQPINKNTITKLELRLAVHVSCHSAISTIDHLSTLVKNEMKALNSDNKIVDNVKLHRTKCSALLKNVISPSLLNEQIRDLKNVNYSLIVDESTDVSCAKHLCICIRYYNHRKNKIVSQFLGLIFVIKTTADVLYQHLKTFFESIGLDLKDCFALATDGGSNLCGCNHSLYTLMKQDNKDLLLVKCVCHSLYLACSYAAAKLPSHIDYMLRETYNRFKRSAIKRDSYRQICKVINDGKEPLRLVQLSKTRWLARSNAVKRILNQWSAIKLQFQLLNGVAVSSTRVDAINYPNVTNNVGIRDQDNSHDIANSANALDVSADDNDDNQDRYVARELWKMYEDPGNILYFTFMNPILTEFEELNVKFQRDHSDHARLLTELENFAMGLFSRVLHPSSVRLNIDFSFTSIYRPIEDVDFGFEFTKLLDEYVKKQIISQNVGYNIKLRCHQFLVTACKEVSKRIQNNTEILRKVKNLSPAICLSSNRPPFKELPLELASPGDIPMIE